MTSIHHQQDKEYIGVLDIGSGATRFYIYTINSSGKLVQYGDRLSVRTEMAKGTSPENTALSKEAKQNLLKSIPAVIGAARTELGDNLFNNLASFDAMATAALRGELGQPGYEDFAQGLNKAMREQLPLHLQSSSIEVISDIRESELIAASVAHCYPSCFDSATLVLAQGNGSLHCALVTGFIEEGAVKVSAPSAYHLGYFPVKTGSANDPFRVEHVVRSHISQDFFDKYSGESAINSLLKNPSI